MALPAVTGQPVYAADMNAKRNVADAILESDLDAGVTAKLNGVSAAVTTAINTASTSDRQRANHTGTQSADTITDGTTNKAYTAAEKTKLAGLSSTGGASASTTVAGVVELATNAETSAGTATGTAGPLVVTPAGLASITAGLLTQTTADGRYDAAGAASAVSSSVSATLATKAPLASPALTGSPTVNGDAVVGGSGITRVVGLTQAQYDALATKVATTLYVITS